MFIPNTPLSVSLEIARHYVVSRAFTVKVRCPSTYRACSPKESPSFKSLMCLSPSKHPTRPLLIK